MTGARLRAHLITTTEECGETERGCVQSTSRSASAGGARVGIILPHLGARTCCGWSFGRSRGPVAVS